MENLRFAPTTRYCNSEGKPCKSWETENKPVVTYAKTLSFKITYRKNRYQINTGCRKKSRAEQVKTRIEDLVDAYKAGEHIDPNEIRGEYVRDGFLKFLQLTGETNGFETAQALDDPWGKHLEAFLESLEAAALDKKYIEGRRRYVSMIADYCGWKTLRDTLQATKANGFLVDLGKKGKSPRTVNEYVHAVRRFGAFLMKSGILAKNPFNALELREEVSVMERRILSDGEFDLLLIAAKGSARTIYRLTGPMRFVLYLLARATGFRSSELGSLTPDNFVFDDRPRVWVSGKNTKNGKDASQPLSPEMVALMKKFLKNKPKNEKVFPGVWPRKGAEIIRQDLEVAKIEYKTAQGQFDFHCLRHQHSTSVMAASPSERVSREITRHSDSKVQDRYAHLNDSHKREVIDKMSVPKALRDELDG